MEHWLPLFYDSLATVFDYVDGPVIVGLQTDDALKARHEMIADYLEEMDTDIKGLRAMMMKASFADEISQRSKIALMYTDPRVMRSSPATCSLP